MIAGLWFQGGTSSKESWVKWQSEVSLKQFLEACSKDVLNETPKKKKEETSRCVEKTKYWPSVEETSGWKILCERHSPWWPQRQEVEQVDDGGA